MTVAEALRVGAARLSHIEGGARDARLLLQHVTGQDAAALLCNPSAMVDQPAYEAALIRRAAHEPVAFITGRTGFWTLDLEVSPATLIPRPDTETLIEAALRERPDRTAVRTVLDLGTGTGCLLLAALAEYPQAWGLGLDLSSEAAALARRNAARNGLAPRASFAAAHWAAPVNARFDLILSNPPYIPTSDLPSLMPDVARYEPRSALDGGPDGLDAYRTLLQTLPTLLSPDGLAILELGMDQAPTVMALAQAADFRAILHPDLNDTPRALVVHP